MRKQGKTDANQSEIVSDLRRHGFSVWVTSGMGGGAPDIVVGLARKNGLFEIKDPDQVPSKRELTPAERIWHLTWNGQIHTVETSDQIMEIMWKL